jgi:hypothetical protein
VTTWLNATGGLRYHLRAWRYRASLWAPFRRAIAAWLAEWSPPERELLLVGPSGGYCVDLGFARRFDAVTAVEIDPVARWILRRRARAALRGARTTLAMDSRDYLSPRDGRFELEGVRALCERYPRAAVLFCNVLGQLPLLGPEPTEESVSPEREGTFEWWLRSLPAALGDRSWASFHDRLSGSVRPRVALPTAPVAWRSSEALVEELYPQTDRDDEVLNDHRTSELAAPLVRSAFVWELVPSVFHLVEGVSVRADARVAASGRR